MTTYDPPLPTHPDFVPAVQIIHPGVDFSTDVILEDRGDGKGAMLVQWNLPGEPPTDAEIEVAMALPPPPPEVPPEVEVLFDHELRLRDLEGKPPVKADEFMRRFKPRA